MFSNIAMLVLQEQVKTRKFANKWRRRVITKQTKSEATEHDDQDRATMESVVSYMMSKAKEKNSNSPEKKLLNRTNSRAKIVFTNSAKENNASHLEERSLKKTNSRAKLVSTNSEKVSKTAFGLGNNAINSPRETKGQKTRKPKKKVERCSNEVFEDVMAEIQKFATQANKPLADPMPNALAIDLAGARASHEDVLRKLKECIQKNRDCHIVSLQYLPQSSRWLISLDSKASCDRLSGQDINVNGNKVSLRRYDDVLALEYKKVSRANGFINNVKDF